MSKPSAAVEEIRPLRPGPPPGAGPGPACTSARALSTPCQVHLGLLDGACPAPATRHRPRLLRAWILAGVAAALGIGLALVVGDVGFGWLGAASTAAVLGSLLARRAGQQLLAALLGTAGFFGASVLACAAVLLAGLAAIPPLLG